MSQQVAALRGAVAFLTRLPVRSQEDDWAAFRATPAAFPVVGYVVGILVALPLLTAAVVPAPTVALGYLLAVYLVTGVHHLDGVADIGDAVFVHGDAEQRREVLKDTTTGVGAVLGVTFTVVGLALAGLVLARLPLVAAVGIVVAAEVGAKLGMAAMACLGHASHQGMGSEITSAVSPSALVFPTVLALPAAAVSWPVPVGAVALTGALVGVAVPWLWARRQLGGVTGDVFGAANELGRLLGTHAGVIAWTLF